MSRTEAQQDKTASLGADSESGVGVLIVDDEPLMRGFLEEALRRQGHRVKCAQSGEAALKTLQTFSPELALLDIRLGGMDGITLLERVREIEPGCACIMMTAHGTVETAVQAMKRGAADFLLKPFSADALEVVISKVLGVAQLQRENSQLRARLRNRGEEPKIIGGSPQIVRLIELARMLARPRATILVMGESGTGKELVAQALHAWGPRARAPFIKVNCAALPAGLMESELFGHEKGAFTGAQGLQRGKFELADGGTLLLDEVSEMELSLQPKLLRCLQEKEFYRVGGVRPVRVDTRIVATTNADLDHLVQEGRFRADLLYRLKVVPVRIPPLRERREDIPLLTQHFLDRALAENGREIRGIDREALDLLMHHDWPGNVRELENVVQRAVVICQEKLIRTDHLLWEGGVASEARAQDSAAMLGAVEVGQGTAGEEGLPDASLTIPGNAPLREVERAWILRTLECEHGNKTAAARRLGISVRTIRNKLRTYGESRAA